jgi:catechol 2,3-dioxygenase-like lactoylglutathione lyase family enzyme
MTISSFDHLGFAVADFARSKAFYLAVLVPLGIGIVSEGEDWILLGRDGQPELWLGASGTPPGPIHLAFKARSRAEVRAFHAAALTAGGRDNGAPGIRGHYHPNYYGAFVFDPDGHNIEAVSHQSEE